MTTQRIPLPAGLEDRLFARRVVTAANCWEWQGTREKGGYGNVSVQGKKRKVHRLSAELWLSDFDPALFVCHHCDNPPCFNPEHLFMGTPADNVADSIRKGRKYQTPLIYLARRPCAVCGTEYEPDGDHRGRSVVCSPACLSEFRRLSGQRRAQRAEFKLTPTDVRSIREALATGARGVDLAAEYGVSKATISLIRHGRTWGHVA